MSVSTESNISRKATRGTIWADIDRFGNMAIQFGVNLIMARLLAPSAFGAIGMLTIFIAVSQTLIDGGFGSALIQKKEPTDKDYNTVFSLSLATSIFLYAIIWLIAPWVGEFYRMEELSDVLRAIGLMLIIGVPVTLQNNKLRKNLRFISLAICNISSMCIGGALGLIAAFNGGGVWALVVMMLSNYFMQAVSMTLATRWIPRPGLCKQSLKKLFGFGGYILAASVLQETCKNLQGLIIGRQFSATVMGFYAQAQKLDLICSYSLPQVIVQVMYPVYSTLQDDQPQLVRMVNNNVRLIAFLIFPLMVTMMILAPWLIQFLYGTKWLPSVPYFQILCIGGMFVCLQNVNFYAVAASGHSRTLFLWSFYKWGFLLAGLLIGMLFGIYGILTAIVLSNINIYVVNALLADKHVGYSWRKQAATLLPILCVTIASAIPMALAIGLGYNHPLLLTCIYLTAYILLACITLRSAISHTLVTIKNLKK